MDICEQHNVPPESTNSLTQSLSQRPPSFYLVLLLFQLFHPSNGLFCFILCYLSWAYTFSMMFIPHCKYFFLSSCTRHMAHNPVNTESLLHRKYTCTRPVRQMRFGVTILKILNIEDPLYHPFSSLGVGRWRVTEWWKRLVPNELRIRCKP